MDLHGANSVHGALTELINEKFNGLITKTMEQKCQMHNSKVSVRRCLDPGHDSVLQAQTWKHYNEV